MRAKALLYRLDGKTERGGALHGVLRENGVLPLDVTAEQLGETAGRLASANAAGTTAPPPECAPEVEFMLLCALGERQLDRLLAAMRRAGLSVPYKAVLTEHNRDWTLEKLIWEVMREHESLNGGQ